MTFNDNEIYIKNGWIVFGNVSAYRISSISTIRLIDPSSGKGELKILGHNGAELAYFISETFDSMARTYHVIINLITTLPEKLQQQLPISELEDILT